MAEPVKKRKMVHVKDARSGLYREFPQEPTPYERLTEGFEANATRAELEALRKKRKKPTY